MTAETWTYAVEVKGHSRRRKVCRKSHVEKKEFPKSACSFINAWICVMRCSRRSCKDYLGPDFGRL